MDEVFHLMRDENLWNMYYPFEPNLIITVIGGAKNFKLDGKKKEVFNRGLVEVCGFYLYLIERFSCFIDSKISVYIK